MKSENLQTLSGQKRKRELSKFFSSTATLWQAIYSKDRTDIDIYYRHFMRKRKAAIYRLLRKHRNRNGARMLDAGCGAGGILQGLKRLGFNVVGTDLSMTMLKEARILSAQSGHSKSLFVQADIEHLPFKAGSFDAIVCAGVLEYLESDKKGIIELGRVAGKGGLIIASLPNMIRIGYLLDPYYFVVRGLKYVWHKIGRKRMSQEDSIDPSDFGSNKTFTNRRYFFTRLDALFCRDGLRKIDTATVGYGPVTFWQKPLISERISLRISDGLDNLTGTRWFRWFIVFSNGWVLCLKKGGT